ncbi:MAG: hypothetical protein JOY80_04355, partial [Candidatus Dormibacteraeota bacterium]|nr:hypothetical protein [Candidatus Dormibacteraeota bacterium]
ASTLRGAAIPSGSTVRLVIGANGAPPPPPPPPPPPHATPAQAPPPAALPVGTDAPQARTAALLPSRRSRAARLGLAVGAFFSPSREEAVVAAADPIAGPSPAALTQARRLGPFARSRLTWRESNYVRALERRIVGPRLVRCSTIAVVSPKGGVGKTTITTLLGTLYAQLRRDRIVAIDTNPDYGSLGRTLAPQHNVFVDDLLDVLGHPALTVTQLDTSLARAQHGLLVLPAPTSPERMARLNEAAYRAVITRLQNMVSVIVLDCGTGLWEPAARAALASAQQVLLVSDAEPATASLVAEASQQLRPMGVPVTIVVNKMSSAGRLDVDRFARSIGWAAGLITITDERRAAASIATGDFDWDRAPRSWRLAARELAAVIAQGWDQLGLTM